MTPNQLIDALSALPEDVREQAEVVMHDTDRRGSDIGIQSVTIEAGYSRTLVVLCNEIIS